MTYLHLLDALDWGHVPMVLVDPDWVQRSKEGTLATFWRTPHMTTQTNTLFYSETDASKNICWVAAIPKTDDEEDNDELKVALYVYDKSRSASKYVLLDDFMKWNAEAGTPLPPLRVKPYCKEPYPVELMNDKTLSKLARLNMKIVMKRWDALKPYVPLVQEATLLTLDTSFKDLTRHDRLCHCGHASTLHYLNKGACAYNETKEVSGEHACETFVNREEKEEETTPPLLPARRKSERKRKAPDFIQLSPPPQPSFTKLKETTKT